jgi:hypothetical protein
MMTSRGRRRKQHVVTSAIGFLAVKRLAQTFVPDRTAAAARCSMPPFLLLSAPENEEERDGGN